MIEMNQIDIKAYCDNCWKECLDSELRYSDANEYYDQYVCLECYKNGA